MDSKDTRSEIEQKATNLIQGKEQLAFYNLNNIYKQLEIFEQIINKENLGEKSKELLLQAVWIYNVSHYFNYEKPLDDSLTIIEKWTDNNEERSQLGTLITSISSTVKNSIEEKVLHDTIFSFWSDKKFEKQFNKLKADDQKHGLYKDDEVWLKSKLDEILQVVFYSASGQELLSDKERKNTGILEKMLKNFGKAKDLLIQEDLKIDAEELKALKKKLKGVEGRSERGVETMFRLASRNLYTRAKILDSKSSILITVNSIILSVVLGTLYGQIADDPHLVMPITMLFITNLASIGFSIVATRPELKEGKFLREDVTNKKASLLNFDDYHSVSLEDYEWALDQAANDADYLYHTIAMDLHHMGTRMQRKYKNLKIAYNIFMWGLIISITLFMACHLFFDWT